MHCTTLADLAAIIAQQGPSIVVRSDSIPASRLTNYWVAFRSRLDLWHQAMSRNRVAHEKGDWVGLQYWWNDHIGVLEEILVTDMLTRVVAGLSAAVDAETTRRVEVASGDSSTDEAATDRAAITHAIHVNHLEARNRVQLLMVNNRGCRVADAVRLNQLRRLTERWTDTWLGRLSIRQPDVVRYAFDPQRVTECAIDFRETDHECAEPGTHKHSRLSDGLMQACMQSAISRQTDSRPSLPAANAAIAHAVLGLMPVGLFDDWGVPKSLTRCRSEQDHRWSDQSPDRLHETIFPAQEAISPSTRDANAEADEPSKDMTNGFHRWYLA